MSQNLPPPAYQEYAANTLSSMHFRMMTNAQRGLCWTMKLELWFNRVLPSDPDTLAKLLAMDKDEVRQNLPAVMPFFAIRDGGIICPQHEDYHATLENRRILQSKAGKKGQKIKKEKAKAAKTHAAQGDAGGKPPLSAVPKVDSSVASTRFKGLSTAKSNTEKQSQNQSVEKGLSPEQSEWADSYKRASNGH